MKQTPLRDVHAELGARLVDFEGWEMPLQYGPILEEAARVRRACGLFDLGHMGRFHVVGPDAVRLVDRVATNYCGGIPPVARDGTGSIRYALLCRASGYPIDDVLLYREQRDVFVVVNASNAAVDLAWMRTHGAGLDAEVRDQTDELAMLALQGPRSQDVLERVGGGELCRLGYYKFGRGRVCGIDDMRVSRTGYTGEDGFELYVPAGLVRRVWSELVAAGRELDLAPIGLAARDTLRLEAGMPLFGHEIDAEHHPLEAGLAFGVSFKEEKGDWIGRAALLALRDAPTRRLVGVTTPGPRVPRQGHALMRGDLVVGAVCSGTVSPTLGTNIASAYVALGADAPGTELELDVRGKRQRATVQDLPFYSRTRKKSPSSQAKA